MKHLTNVLGSFLFQVRHFLQKRRAVKSEPITSFWIGQKGLTDSQRAELQRQVEEYITVHPVRNSLNIVGSIKRISKNTVTAVTHDALGTQGLSTCLSAVVPSVSWRVPASPWGGAAAAAVGAPERRAAAEGGAEDGGSTGSHTHTAGAAQRSQLHTSSLLLSFVSLFLPQAEIIHLTWITDSWYLDFVMSYLTS